MLSTTCILIAFNDLALRKKFQVVWSLSCSMKVWERFLYLWPQLDLTNDHTSFMIRIDNLSRFESFLRVQMAFKNMCTSHEPKIQASQVCERFTKRRATIFLDWLPIFPPFPFPPLSYLSLAGEEKTSRRDGETLCFLHLLLSKLHRKGSAKQ